MSIARVLLSSLVPAVVLVSLVAAPQLASSSDGGLPGGSWRQTCQNAYVRDGVLYAQCQRNDGRYGSASVQITSCQAFGNRDGQLFCESSGDGRYGGNQWDGSFRNSCRNISIESNGDLLATCPTGNGGWRQSRLSARDCGSYRAGTRDGNLVCESRWQGSNGGNQWDGSFRNSCREITVDASGKLSAKCRKNNGTYKHTKLTLANCPSYRAGNRDGNLVCEPREQLGSGDQYQWDGSFRNSCRNISIESDGDLLATCPTGNGGWRQSRLSARDCGSYRAGNRDGNLVCEPRDQVGSAGQRQWDGSFRNSCRDVSMESDGDLLATCQTANGAWRQSRLSARDCDIYRAGNRDGQLYCER